MQLENQDSDMFNFTELDKQKIQELGHSEFMESECKTWGVLRNRNDYVLKQSSCPKQLMVFKDYNSLERFLLG